jgi:dienelactone hydrolase
MEDLASHGYAVIGVEHTYETPGVVFPDGRVVTAASDFMDRLRRESGNADSFEKRLTDLRAADLRFVIDQLQDLEKVPKWIFRSRLDLTQIGAFGHSRGGRSAVRACQLDPRIKACLNQDGSLSWQPFWPDESGRSLRQPFLMLDHFDPDPPLDVFIKMGTTREQYVGRRSARQAEAREKLYGTIAGGAYQVTIKTPGVSHNSFADIRQLGRPDGSGINAWPEDVRAATPHAQILQTINVWTRAFFDQSVRKIPKPLAELTRAAGREVEIRTYRPSVKSPE